MDDHLSNKRRPSRLQLKGGYLPQLLMRKKSESSNEAEAQISETLSILRIELNFLDIQCLNIPLAADTGKSPALHVRE